MGALASGILLYGISLLYGASSDITFVTMPIAVERLMVFKFSMVFILTGLFFKLGLMPFHMWLPDVYEGAPTSVTALLATAPKIAVAVVVGRFLFSTYASIITDWQHIIIVLAVLSIGFGNLIAIVQNNIKRMLAYSTIANIGFAILGFMIKEPFGFAAAMFYVVSYSIMYLGIFGVLLLLSKDDITFIELEDFNGLWIRYPWLAVALLLLLFALVGIPPFAGFYAKFLVLKMLMEHGFVDLAILAVVFSVIGVFYCLKIVKAIFFECAVTYPLKQSISPFGGLVLACNCLVVVFLGIFVAI
jgi:NADH-quinone oxidoreductase subunit N